MHYRLHMSLTEADYLEFNNFHTLQSKTGKKLVRTRRIFFISVMVVSMALVFLILGQTLF